MNCLRACRPLALALLGAALAAAATLRAVGQTPSASTPHTEPARAPVTPMHIPWTVRHELNRAQQLLLQQSARLHLGNDVQVLRMDERVVLRVPAHLLFAPDTQTLRPGLKAAQVLSVPTLLLRRRRHLMTRIEVYSDNIGGIQLNQQLSARRATMLASQLQLAGISTHRIQAYGRGGSQALAGNDSAEGRTLNRRVEFVFARLGSQAALAPPEAAPSPPGETARPSDSAPNGGAPAGGAASAGVRPAPAAMPAGG
ncbi:MAG TPA: OmpA family protein [Steroidobacteraceae bacterium]|nr:OmpA family protein [Steroidobacteraceae bacterium]